MKNFVNASLFAAMLALPAMAGENFGGIGVTIYAVNEGVLVSDVIPGSPAAEAGLESKDRIIAVDGVSIAGNDIDASKEVLRGTVGRPVELSVLREKETFNASPCKYFGERRGCVQSRSLVWRKSEQLFLGRNCGSRFSKSFQESEASFGNAAWSRGEGRNEGFFFRSFRGLRGNG